MVNLFANNGVPLSTEWYTIIFIYPGWMCRECVCCLVEMCRNALLGILEVFDCVELA